MNEMKIFTNKHTILIKQNKKHNNISIKNTIKYLQLNTIKHQYQAHGVINNESNENVGMKTKRENRKRRRNKWTEKKKRFRHRKISGM